MSGWEVTQAMVERKEWVTSAPSVGSPTPASGVSVARTTPRVDNGVLVYQVGTQVETAHVGSEAGANGDARRRAPNAPACRGAACGAAAGRSAGDQAPQAARATRPGGAATPDRAAVRRAARSAHPDRRPSRLRQDHPAQR